MKRINFETAKLAKEKGFDEKVHVGYTSHELLTIRHTPPLSFNDNCEYRTYYSAPTQSFLQKWLRETYNIRVFYVPSVVDSIDKYWQGHVYYKSSTHFTTKDILKYEQALEQGLQKGLELIYD